MAEGLTRRLTIAAPATEVFDAVATLEGLRGWWTSLVSGDTSVGGAVQLRFQGLDEQIVMRVDSAEHGRLLAWTCLENSGHPEWQSTEITFTLEAISAESTLLDFEHRGLVPSLACYETCEVGWDHFLASIASYVETGRGAPFA